MEEKELITSCLEGNRQSLEKLVNSVQDQVFNLSLRFLWNRQDAEDATQEILIKVMTSLSKFEGSSKFSTWVYRIATNYLINKKQTKLEQTFSSFDVFAEDLTSTLEKPEYNQPDTDIMVKEVKTGCTLAMLQCLDRNLRISFILGSVLKINSTVASEITETSPANFRKRLELSRKKIGSFLNGYCGVFNPENSCRCRKKISYSISKGRMTKSNLHFVGKDKVEMYNNEMEELNSLAGIYQNHGKFKHRLDFVSEIDQLISSKKIVSHNTGN